MSSFYLSSIVFFRDSKNCLNKIFNYYLRMNFSEYRENATNGSFLDSIESVHEETEYELMGFIDSEFKRILCCSEQPKSIIHKEKLVLNNSSNSQIEKMDTTSNPQPRNSSFTSHQHKEVQTTSRSRNTRSKQTQTYKKTKKNVATQTNSNFETNFSFKFKVFNFIKSMIASVFILIFYEFLKNLNLN